MDDQFNFWKSYEQAVHQMIEKERQTIIESTIYNEQEKEDQIQELESSLLHFNSLTDKDLHQQLVKDGKRYMSQKATMASLFIHLYRQMPALQLPHKVLMALVDIGEFFSLWKYRHVLLAHRMRGNKVGTGGSSGHAYLLKSAMKGKIFQDFYNLTTFLLPSRDLPDLPSQLKDKLNFHLKLNKI